MNKEFQERLDKLLDLAEKATPEISRWKAYATGLIPKAMATLDIISSHNRTPYISWENAKYLEAANPETIKLLVESLRDAIEALEEITLCKPAGKHNDGLGHIAIVDMVILPTAKEALRKIYARMGEK